MSLIKEFAKIINLSRRQYQNATAKPLYLKEEIGGKNGEEIHNILCCGDNKTVMKSLLAQQDMDRKLKLIYLDPPFFSKGDYDAVVKAGDENIRHRAYGDRWEKGLSEYLKMLTSRLYLMRDLLADDGLIWLHLDWHVVHYAKVIMDEIFGEKNFVNEIIWTYKSGGTSKKHFSRKHDTILVYSKTKHYDFYPLQEKSYNRKYKPYRFKNVKEYRDELGWYTMVNMKDVWNIDMVGRTSSERTGYATQKPEQLMRRIIESCTKEGDLCADFFCGSGTFPAVAAQMNRRFIACDAGILAVESTISRLARQNTAFRVYDVKAEQPSSLRVKIKAETEELAAGDKKLVRLSLEGVQERGLAKTVGEQSKALVKKVMAEDSLQMIAAWSADFHQQGQVHRPDVIFVRNKAELETECTHIVTAGSRICVKITDIFGNTAFERIEV